MVVPGCPGICVLVRTCADLYETVRFGTDSCASPDRLAEDISAASDTGQRRDAAGAPALLSERPAEGRRRRPDSTHSGRPAEGRRRRPDSTLGKASGGTPQAPRLYSREGQRRDAVGAPTLLSGRPAEGRRRRPDSTLGKASGGNRTHNHRFTKAVLYR